MDEKWINSNQEFPDNTNIYLDPRQIIIPPINGKTEYLNQPEYPDYLVNGGNGQIYDIIDGGNGELLPIIGDV